MNTITFPQDATRDDRKDRILRYTLGERVTHWIAGLSYIYLLITGLAFWSHPITAMRSHVGCRYARVRKSFGQGARS